MDPSALAALLAKKAELETRLDGFEIWLLIFGVFVVVGVAGESIFGARTWWNNRKLHGVQQDIEQYRETEIVRLRLTSETISRDTAQANERALKAQVSLSLAEQHSAEANAKAEGFRLDIARANERAASANEIAERERLARLQLEAKLADRILTDEQQQSIGKILKQFGTVPTQIFTYADTTEVLRISDSIGKALAVAAWPVGMGKASGGIIVTGIVLAVAKAASQQAKNAAARLASELTRSGIGAQFTDTPIEDIPGPGMVFGSSVPSEQLRIMIGSK